MKKVYCLFICMVFLAAAGAADVVTNYYHGFSGSVEEALHGTAPDVRPGDETFNANTVFKADGSFDWDGSVAPRGVAVLPLSIEPGRVYTASLEVHIEASSHDNHGVGLSFWTDSGSTTQSPLGATQQEATLLLRYQGGGRLIAYGDYQVNGNSFIHASGLGVGLTQTLSMKLYTYEDETPWRVEYYMGESMVHELTFNEAPQITHIAIGTAHGDISALLGSMDSFKIVWSEHEEPSPDIYYHGFGGSAEEVLHGVAPDVRPGNETFNANTVFKADGSFDWDGSVAPRGVAVLPLTIEPGRVYTASLDVDIAASSHDSHGVGLAFWTGPGGTAHSPLGTSQQEATLLLRYQGGGRLYAYGDYEVNGNSLIHASGLGVGLTQTLRMKLYTYTDETPWRVEYYMGESMVHELSFAEAPQITHFAIGTVHGDTSALSGSMGNFNIVWSDHEEEDDHLPSPDIYYHGFSGSAEVVLHGVAPDVRPGDETFNANAVFKADGSFGWDGSVLPRGVAVLPLTIEPGRVYTASLDVDIAASSHNNHGVGLSFWTGPGNTAHSPLGTSQQEATLLLRYQGGGRLYAYGDYEVNGNNFIYASGTGVGLTQTLRMKLYTYEDETPWKVRYYVGESMMHELTFAEAPEITHFAIGTAHGDTSALSGSMDNFRINTVPLPTHATTLAIHGISIGEEDIILHVSAGPSNALYTVLGTRDLIEPDWLQVDGAVDIPALGPDVVQEVYLTREEDQGFYRLRSP